MVDASRWRRYFLMGGIPPNFSMKKLLMICVVEISRARKVSL